MPGHTCSKSAAADPLYEGKCQLKILKRTQAFTIQEVGWKTVHKQFKNIHLKTKGDLEPV